MRTENGQAIIKNFKRAELDGQRDQNRMGYGAPRRLAGK
jgi:hypothetical protein